MGGPAEVDHGSNRALARSSAIMASGTLVSRVLGLVRMALLIAAVGAQTDAANVWDTANTIPNTIYLLLAAGVLNVVLLPQITRAMVRGGEAGQDYIDRLLTLAFTVVAAGTALVLLAAPLVTKLMALSWPWGGEKLTLAVLFAYLCIPQVLFYGLHTILGQVLAAHHRFGAFMWSPALANVVAITGLGIFLARYGDVSRAELSSWTPGMIWLLAGSATLGIVVQALVLIPAVRSTGFTYRPRWGFRGVGLGSASRMSSWAFAEILLSQAGMLVAINMLNDAVQDVSEAPGKAAHFAAFSTFMLPHSLIALSLLTAIFPVLSKAAAAGELRLMAEQLGRALRLLGAAMVPIAVGMIVLAPLVVRVINPTMTPFEHLWVTRILFALLVGLVPYGVYLVCARVFYAFEDARTPFLFQVALTGVLLVFCVVAYVQGAWWVAVLVGLGQAMGQIAAMLMGLRAVRRKLPDLDLRRAGVVFLKAGGAALVALLPAWLIVRTLEGDGWLGAVVPLAVAGPVFVAVYAVLAHLLGVAEVTEVGAPLLRRIPGASRLVRPHGGSQAPGTTPVTDPGTPPTSASVAELGPGAGTLGWDGAPEGAVSGGEDGDMDQLEVGTRLGDRYALEELLAEREGGGLQYWSARDVTLGRLVAVTVLPSGGEHARIAEAVLDAARRVASVDDPRLVRVLDVGEEDTLCWIIEEGLSEAESLASLVDDRPLPAEEVRRLIGETAAGLESARRRGLHHLYLNPHSVLRTTDGTVKISGVGVAAALEGADDVTADEASLIDTADLVSLLYTGLTGRWPGEDLPGVSPARRLADGTLPAPSELVSGVPGDLDALCRIVHGAGADLAAAPHTPGELARQLAPWSPDIVTGTPPGELTAPRESAGDSRTRAGDALAGSAGASAAATAAHPTKLPDSDPTEQVPRPYYRTHDGRGATGAGAAPYTGEDDGVGSARPGTAGVAGAGLGAGAAGAGSPDPADSRPPREESSAFGGFASTDERDGLAEERANGLQNIAVLAVILAIVAVAALAGWAVWRSLGDGDEEAGGPTPGATAPVDPAGETATEGTDEEGATAPVGEESGEDTGTDASGAVAIRGITSFDPEGDGDERNDLTPLAVDGDSETAWTSHTYLSEGWGSLKSGTGLILDLGEGAQVSEVEVELGEGTMGARLYLSDSASRDGATELGAGEALEGTWSVAPESPATGRYLILWFDTAARTDAGEIVSVREISVR